MSIISKKTWDSIPQEEKEKLRSIYLEAKKVGTRNITELEEYFGKENLQPQPQLTYEDVARELFENGELYWITENGYIGKKELNQNSSIIKDANNCTSRKQAEKLLAINKLLNVTAYLGMKGLIDIVMSDDLRLQACQILGEDTVRLALSSDF